MKYPTLPVGKSSRETVEGFMGYNHNHRIADGEFFEMENMSSEELPVLSPRKPRGVMLRGEKLTGVTYVDNFGLVYTDGPELRSLNGVRLPMELSEAPKRFIQFGAYVVIWPDMKYFNTQILQDYGDIGHAVQATQGEASFSLCDPEGEAYSNVTVSDTAPDTGTLWLDTSGTPHTLRRYVQASGEWVAVSSTCVKITAPGIGGSGMFNRDDTVFLSGITAEGAQHLNGTAVLMKQPALNTIVVAGILDKTVTQDCAVSPIGVARRVPVMDHIIEAGNRLWGCRYGKNSDGVMVNELYASRLGDFKNWESFQGISTDSWAASVGSPGAFTGAVNLGGYPVFYKENMKHKVWISDTGAHQVTSTSCDGVKSGCGGSVATVDGVAIYKSNRGFCLDDGSVPTPIGQCFGNREYSGARGHGYRNKYYVSMRDEEGGQHLFVYDTRKALWCREDDLNVVCFCRCWAVDADTNTLLDLPGDTQRSQMEGPVSWMVQTGDLGLSLPDRKYISRLTVRMSLDIGTEVSFYARYDHEDKWLELGSVHGSSLRTFSLPVRPRRCDHLRLMIRGTGMARIYSITKTMEQGSELP